MHHHTFYTVSPDNLREYISATQPSAVNTRARNITLLSDESLLRPGTVALFTIRHPVLTVVSAYRAMNATHTGGSRAAYMIGMNVGFTRELYDWYVSKGSANAIVVDADDYMTSEAFIRHLADTIGLDPHLVTVSWPKLTQKGREEMHPVLLAVQNTLVESEGLDPSRAAKNVDVNIEEEKWRGEFGEEVAELLGELVGMAMPHYLYLHERRLRL